MLQSFVFALSFRDYMLKASAPYAIVSVVQESLGLLFKSLGLNFIASQTP